MIRLPDYPEGMSDSVTLFMCGDVMTGRGIDQVMPSSCDPRLYEGFVRDAGFYVTLAERRKGTIEAPVTLDYVWGYALKELEHFKPEVRLINLETSITCHPEPWPDKGIHYRMHPDNAAFLNKAGISACALANNHLLDWGRPGLTETLKVLSGQGVAHAGAGPDLPAASEPARLKLGAGKRVLIWSLGFANSGIPPDWAALEDRSGVWWAWEPSVDSAEVVAERIRAEQRPGDLVVVSVHWGGNWGYEIPPGHRAFAHRLIDAGAHLIHGHSSHHPKGMELYRGAPILYGCGDFINDYEGIGGHESFHPQLTLMYFGRFGLETGKLERFWMTPLRIERFSLHRAERHEAQTLCDIMNRERAEDSPSIERDGQDRLRWV